MGIFNEIKAAFSTSPKRYAPPAAPPNWFGELEGRKQPKAGAVLVDSRTRTFEFGRTIEGISPHLTEADRASLAKRNLDPDNPAYARCKEYFAKMPFCGKKDMAAASADEFGLGGISANTAKDVLGAFREFMVAKPSF